MILRMFLPAVLTFIVLGPLAAFAMTDEPLSYRCRIELVVKGPDGTEGFNGDVLQPVIEAGQPEHGHLQSSIFLNHEVAILARQNEKLIIRFSYLPKHVRQTLPETEWGKNWRRLARSREIPRGAPIRLFVKLSRGGSMEARCEKYTEPN